MRIGLDLDDTINFWWSEYVKLFGDPKNDYEIIRNIEKRLKKDKSFWLNLPIKNRPDFEVELFCTKRVIPKSWSKEYLKRNGIPVKPIYQMYYQYGKKSSLIKGRVDLFIDDSISNMIELNLAGIPCLLMDSENNKSWGSVGRVYSLNYDEIIKEYNKFMKVFHNFKEIVCEYKTSN